MCITYYKNIQRENTITLVDLFVLYYSMYLSFFFSGCYTILLVCFFYYSGCNAIFPYQCISLWSCLGPNRWKSWPSSKIQGITSTHWRSGTHYPMLADPLSLHSVFTHNLNKNSFHLVISQICNTKRHRSPKSENNQTRCYISYKLQMSRSIG